VIRREGLECIQVAKRGPIYTRFIVGYLRFAVNTVDS